MHEHTSPPEYLGPLQVNELFRSVATLEQANALSALQTHFLQGPDRLDSEAAARFDMHHDLLHVGTEIDKNCHYEFQSQPTEGITRLIKTSDEGVESAVFETEDDGSLSVRWQPSLGSFTPYGWVIRCLDHISVKLNFIVLTPCITLN